MFTGRFSVHIVTVAKGRDKVLSGTDRACVDRSRPIPIDDDDLIDRIHGADDGDMATVGEKTQASGRSGR